MFRHIRRKDRALDRDDAMELLSRAEWGVLSTSGSDGWPYGVPVNHVVVDGSLYLHCARRGHKLDNITANDRVSYCVVTTAEVLGAQLSTRFECAIVFGRAAMVDDLVDKRRALNAMVERLAPQRAGEDVESIAGFEHTTVIRIVPEHVTGKANR